MTRLLPLLFVACANLPEVEPCEPGGELIPPSYLRVGNDDQLVASLAYEGCPDVWFRLCGVGEGWLQPDTVRLGMWHDPAERTACEGEVFIDQPVSLGPVRRRYESEFGIQAGTIRLVVGDLEADYSFAPPPR